MLWLLEFTREGRRYRAELRSELGDPLDFPRQPAQAFWFVSVNGDVARRAFEGDVRDQDTQEFRDRVVSAARMERRRSAERRKSARPDAPSDRRSSPRAEEAEPPPP